MKTEYGQMLTSQRKFLSIKKENPELAESLAQRPKGEKILEELAAIPKEKSVWPESVVDIYNDPSN